MQQQDYSSILSRLHTHLAVTRTTRTTARDKLFIAIHYYGPCTREELLQREPSLSRVSLYKNLRLFLQLDIAQEVKPGLFELTDRFKQHHHYMWCRICGKAVGLYDIALEKALTRAVEHRNFALEEHHLEATVICPSCLLNPSNKPRQAIGLYLRRNIS